MTAHALLSPRAEGDVAEIWDYTAKRWGVRQAEAYLRQIKHHVTALADNRLHGRPCPEIRSGYYKYPSGSHVLFYRATDEGIQVIRILHERMDFRRYL